MNLLCSANSDRRDKAAVSHRINVDHTFGRRVVGLARSGSTLLLNLLYGTRTFCSLTYADMPFPLMPRIWSRLRKQTANDHSLIKRAHGDGMNIGLHSPEAIEEVFWKLHTGDNYISRNCLVPYRVKSACIENFRDYVGRILKTNVGFMANRYLSKNNNNILRLPSILTAFPRAKVIIPFRHPLTHSGSLLNQHSRFCEQQEKDKFIEDYMAWLGHHEFGRTHKPFYFGSVPMIESDFPTESLNYWLKNWNDTYDFLLNTVGDESIFFCYESLCADPTNSLRQLCDAINVDIAKLPGVSININEQTIDSRMIDQTLARQSRIIYDGLRERSINGFNIELDF